MTNKAIANNRVFMDWLKNVLKIAINDSSVAGDSLNPVRLSY
jgi:hypothetical protein